MIDLRVMNDFAHNKKPAILENFARGISEINRALDTVTKPKLFSQPHRGVAHGNDSTRATYFLDNVAAIVRFDLFLHRGHHVGRAQIDFLACRCAAGNKIRAHDIVRRAAAAFYSSNGPLGFSTAAEVIITEAGGSGVLESSTR